MRWRQTFWSLCVSPVNLLLISLKVWFLNPNAPKRNIKLMSSLHTICFYIWPDFSSTSHLMAFIFFLKVMCLWCNHFWGSKEFLQPLWRSKADLELSQDCKEEEWKDKNTTYVLLHCIKSCRKVIYPPFKRSHASFWKKKNPLKSPANSITAYGDGLHMAWMCVNILSWPHQPKVAPEDESLHCEAMCCVAVVVSGPARWFMAGSIDHFLHLRRVFFCHCL